MGLVFVGLKCFYKYLEVLGETFVELLVVLLVLGQLDEELQSLLDDVLANDLQDLALLQHFSGDVEGQVLGVDHSTDKVWRLKENMDCCKFHSAFLYR